MNYKTRYFNTIERIEAHGYIKKISKDTQKLKAEYDYWYALPENLQHYFVQPFNFNMNGDTAHYYMEELYVKNAGDLLVSGELSDLSFDRLFKKIKEYRATLPGLAASEDAVDQNAKSLVLDKTRTRLEELKNTPWNNSNYALKLAQSGITLDGLYEKLTRKFLNSYVNRQTKRIILSHGDLTLSNILWEDKIQLMKLVDPKGKDYLYMDEYYDLAKLSQSINGNYDDIVYENYSFDIDSATLEIARKQNDYQQQTFKEYLKNEGIDVNLVRIYEASLFLSMLPFHLDDQQRMAAFLVNCNKILENI